MLQKDCHHKEEWVNILFSLNTGHTWALQLRDYLTAKWDDQMKQAGIWTTSWI